MKPIETFYNGYRFRSRLEARWAVFFDSMGIKYEYELEGFELDMGDEIIRYLPDFYLPEYDLYAEVKPAHSRGELKAEDEYKMSWMIDYAGPLSKGLLMLGYIPDPVGAHTMCYAVQRWSGESLEWGYTGLGDYPEMGYFDGYDHHSAPCSFDDDIMLTGSVICGRHYCGSKVENALIKARQARFEFGE